MQIRSMHASFGKLNNDSLQLRPGFNLIYAPNESGKSTWCHFIRTMLYGLPKRERGALAEKNRFAPWSGSPMAGTMDIDADGTMYHIIRRTAAPAFPMGEFSCTYGGTSISVPGITGQDLGENLLGVGREVFARSAFIGQGGMSLDPDAELERRISALVTSGEEDISYSESYERLKKQLNRRRHNKTGLLPALEQDIRNIRDILGNMQHLLEQEVLAREQLQQYARQVKELELRLTQWEALEKQEALRRYRQAENDATAAQQYADALTAADPFLPEEAELARLIGMADTLDRTLSTTEAAGELAVQQQKAAAAAQARWQAHTLYPADEGHLAGQQAELAAAIRPFSLLSVLISLLVGAATGAGLWFWLQQPLPACCTAGVVCLILLLFLNLFRLRKNRRAKDSLTEFEENCRAYLPLRQEALTQRAEAERSAAAARSLHHSCKQGLTELLQRTQPFAPDVSNLTNVTLALRTALSRRRALDQAQNDAKQARLHCRLLHEHLPQGPLPEPDQVLPRPTTSAEQIRAALPRAMAGVQAAQSQLDNLSGQLSAMGERDVWESKLTQKEAEHQRLQAEYDAIALATEALQEADATLHSRFSPLLSQRAAEIFSALTGGAYDKVLFHRDFSLSAQSAAEITPHSIALLSHGASDQLYLAVRLAICQMVLPESSAAPLILDDALANFDDERMAAALDWLVEESRHRQILFFTCQQREGAYLRRHDGVHHLRL